MILVTLVFINLVFYCTIQNLIVECSYYLVKRFYLQDFSFSEHFTTVPSLTSSHSLISRISSKHNPRSLRFNYYLLCKALLTQDT